MSECLNDLGSSEYFERRAVFGSPRANEFHALIEQILPQLLVARSVREVQATQVEGYERQVATESGHIKAAVIDDVALPNLYKATKLGTRFEAVVK